jgi:UDP-2,3-diacylglucosamine pyrophosphatase LpxH
VRIAFTSDLHADATPVNAALVPHLASRAAALAPDVLILAGDVAETTAIVEETLAAFSDIGTLRLYVAGNHDLFVEGDPAAAGDSLSKLEETLPAAARRAGFLALHDAPAALGDTSFVGIPGWYDYSLRDPACDGAISLDQYRAGVWRGIRAFDRGHVFWPASGSFSQAPAAQPATAPGRWAGDEEIHAAMLEKLDRQLRAVPASHRIVAIVHVLAFQQSVVRGAFGSNAFHDAYLGSDAYGARLERDGRVVALVSGHLHRAAGRFASGGIQVHSSPIGTLRDAKADLASIAASRLAVVDLP